MNKLVVKLANLTFGEVVEALAKGEIAARHEWVHKRGFVFMRPADNIEVHIIEQIKSLPNRVKQYYRGSKGSQETGLVRFHSYLCKKNKMDEIDNGWIPSQEDVQADDWCLLEVE